MNLTDVSAFDVARLAAAFGWGLVSALWSGITGAFGAAMVAYTRRQVGLESEPQLPMSR